jgi:hypothetical protein
MQQRGAWKPYNVKALVSNVEQVFKTGSIEQLNKPTYQFITLHMGFIAHYNLLGFQDEYQDLRNFCQKLQTSENSTERDYNLRAADKYETDSDFRKWYGEAYNKSKAEAIRGIVEVARKYEQATAASFGQRQKNQELAVAKSILTKSGLDLPAKLERANG